MYLIVIEDGKVFLEDTKVEKTARELEKMLEKVSVYYSPSESGHMFALTFKLEEQILPVACKIPESAELRIKLGYYQRYSVNINSLAKDGSKWENIEISKNEKDPPSLVSLAEKSEYPDAKTLRDIISFLTAKNKIWVDRRAKRT